MLALKLGRVAVILPRNPSDMLGTFTLSIMVNCEDPTTSSCPKTHPHGMWLNRLTLVVKEETIWDSNSPLRVRKYTAGKQGFPAFLQGKPGENLIAQIGSKVFQQLADRAVHMPKKWAWYTPKSVDLLYDPETISWNIQDPGEELDNIIFNSLTEEVAD